MAKTPTAAKKPQPAPKPQADVNNLEANLAKAVGTPKPAADEMPAAAKKPGRFNVPPPPAPPADYDEAILKQPVQEGSPCQVKGCPGRYSILQTRRAGTQLVRDYICRTCQQIPKAAK